MSAGHVDVVVRYRTQGYEAAAGGKRASSTHSAVVAAERLGDKIFGPGQFRAEQLPAAPGDDHLVSRVRLVGSR